MAERSTVFFDEVGELPLSMQVKLLRVLQERTLLRVGGTEEIPVDIRVLAATNKDLKREAEEGAFRTDLFYRLDVLTIKVPSLSERREDIPLLANHFLAKYTRPEKVVPRLSLEAAQRLMSYEYPDVVSARFRAEGVILKVSPSNHSLVGVGTIVCLFHFLLYRCRRQSFVWRAFNANLLPHSVLEFGSEELADLFHLRCQVEE